MSEEEKKELEIIRLEKVISRRSLAERGSFSLFVIALEGNRFPTRMRENIGMKQG